MAGSNRRLLGAGTALLAGLAAAAALPGRARAADLFSPGPLARPHAELEGLTQCTKCHAAGQQVSGERCLACHAELKDRVARGRGLHGRLTPAEHACEACHHDHQGADFAMIDWGAAGRERFDHARSGYELKGKHAGVVCARCHDRRLVADPAVRALLEKQPKRQPYLGAPVTCAACHFDEHRTQLEGECQQCHVEQGWKPSRGFNHARTTYRLEAKHATVACEKCHPPRADEATPPDAFPAPVARTFVAWKPLPHASCLACHKDPHTGKFGEACQGCHVMDGWKTLTAQGRERAFHLKTRYPLEGAHALVACRACHGPFGQEKARYKDMAFRACADCHADAHVGQLARTKRGAAGCEACHTVQGWQPVRYELEDHARSAYPLDGAHRAVACGLCHPRNDKLALRTPEPVRAALAREGRPVRVSPAVLTPAHDRCESCHRDPHAGQFATPGRGASAPCAACHQVASWRELRFDHGRDGRFPLQGKHAKAPCASCHPTGAGGATAYRSVETACAACHPDVHAGQLARTRGAPSECGRCHDAAGWKVVLFAHAPPYTAFRLEGKHARLKCVACHDAVAVASGVETRRYKPLPTACEGCHADYHRGAFRGFEP